MTNRPYEASQMSQGSGRLDIPFAINIASDRAELLWMRRLKPVLFREYGVDPGVGTAVACLSQQELFWGPTVLDMNGDRVVTRGTIFRGPTPGDLVGPYLSQYLVMAAMERVQRQSDPLTRVPICMADTVAYVKEYSMYQPYLDAATVLHDMPELTSDRDLLQLQTQVVEVAIAALRMATDRYQYDERLLWVRQMEEDPQQLRIPDEDEAKSEGLAVVAQAAIAGAGTALLVAEFGADTPISQPAIPTPDGLGLEAYYAQGAGSLGVLTIEGELEKLATNLVIARAMPRTPWRKLFSEAFELGQQIAKSMQ